jgi:hypothetical protein
MATRKANPLTLDAIVDNPDLLRTIGTEEMVRLRRRFRALFDIMVMTELDRFDRTRWLVEEWRRKHQPPGAENTPRRRLHGLPGGISTDDWLAQEYRKDPGLRRRVAKHLEQMDAERQAHATKQAKRRKTR